MAKNDTISQIAPYVVVGGLAWYVLRNVDFGGLSKVGTATGDLTSDIGAAGGSWADFLNLNKWGLKNLQDQIDANQKQKAPVYQTTIYNIDGTKSVLTSDKITPQPAEELISARAEAAANYSGGSYNKNSGVLILDQKGYSVMPSNVPSMISTIKRTPSQSPITSTSPVLKTASTNPLVYNATPNNLNVKSILTGFQVKK